jgi:hypothetical protein
VSWGGGHRIAVLAPPPSFEHPLAPGKGKERGGAHGGREGTHSAQGNTHLIAKHVAMLAPLPQPRM